MVEVGGLNLAYTNVPQHLVGGKADAGEAIGALGFALDQSEGPQYLKYDPRSNSVRGDLFGYLDADYMNRLSAKLGDAKGDYFETPRQPAYVSVAIALSQPLGKGLVEGEITRQKADMSVEVMALADTKQALPAYRIDLAQAVFEVEQVAIFPLFEIAKRLCIQPVRIGQFSWTPWGGFTIKLSGDGLDFGMPGARKEWAKADVVFNVKDWITVWKPQYMTLTSAEATALRGEVNDNQCVEVFFVDRFSPQTMWGGGATWGLGTAGTKIISSDENADFGVDLTHLGHELGHSIALPHPDGSAGVSTNTLMCPSGFNNDNPKLNSQENKDNISNPLFTFAIKMRSAGPDCDDSADCGACP